MKSRKSAVLLMLSVSLAGAVQIAGAQTAVRDQTQTQTQTQQRIYGSQLMTQQEMNEYRERMRLAKTDVERERIRAEHHERMKARASERNVTLPDEPPAKKATGQGTGMGPGSGMGGSGSGGGGGGGRR